jgi:hypothetical protein
MSFPSSPLNNQVAIVNNISYKYVSSTNTWNRIATSNVGFYYVTTTTLNANNEAYVGGVSILPFAQAAFNAANTITNNITVLQGVDTTQNTNITVIQGVDTAQNTRMSIIEGVDTTQNTNITVIQGVDTAQNTRMSIIEGVDVGQNTRMSIIEGVDTTQNTNITAINTYATSAYGKANLANVLAQAAFDKANTANNTLVLSSRLVSTSSNSYYFNGSSDVSSPDSSAFNFGTGDFTVECWVYITRTVGVGTDGFFQNKSGDNLNLQRNTSGNLQAWDGSDRISSTAVSSNAWHHVAFCRASGTARIFVDGTLATSWSSTVNYNASRGFALGYTAGGGNRMNGYISNFRVVNGTALYTSTFTPSTTPLTAVNGTSLLTAKTLSIEDLSTNAFSMTNNGVTTSSQSPTFGNTSVNVSIQYVTNDNSWEFTNDGTTYYKIADTEKVNAAFAAANTNATNINNILSPFLLMGA